MVLRAVCAALATAWPARSLALEARLARFDPAFLDRLRDQLPVSQVVGQRVKLNRKGKEQWGLCPFHHEKSPSFKVSDDRGRYHCFGCGKDGDIVTFVMETEGLNFPEAVERLASFAGLELPAADPQAAERADKRKSYHEIMELACRFYEAQLKSGHHRAAQDYIQYRALAPQTLALYRVGYAPPGNQLKTALEARGVSEADMLALGLIKKPDDGRAPFDFFRDRLVFPISDRQGRIIAFGGRVLGDGKPKYLNSSDTPLFNKSETLFGLAQARQAIHANRALIVAEGYMDVLALAQAGFRYALAPLGTAMTEQHLSLLWRLAPEPILCLDGDSAGQAAAQRAGERALPLLKPGQSLRFLTLPQGQDPDDFLKDQGASAFSQALEAARPMSEQLWSACLAEAPTDSPERQAAFWARMRALADSIHDPEVKRGYHQLWRGWYEAQFFAQRSTPQVRSDRGSTWGQQGRTGRFAGRSNFGHPSNSGYQPQPTRHTTPSRDSLMVRGLEGLLLALTQHPALLPDYAEALSRVHFPRPNLAKWCADLLDAALMIEERAGNLDTEALRCHLTAALEAYGDTDRLQTLASSLAPYASRESSDDVARSGIEEFLTMLQEQQARDEQKRSQIEQLKQRVSGEQT
jgi:DNA primase